MISPARTEKLTSLEIFAAEVVHFERNAALDRRLSVGGARETETHLFSGHRLDERVLGQGSAGAVRMCLASRRTVTVWQTS